MPHCYAGPGLDAGETGMAVWGFSGARERALAVVGVCRVVAGRWRPGMGQ